MPTFLITRHGVRRVPPSRARREAQRGIVVPWTAPGVFRRITVPPAQAATHWAAYIAGSQQQAEGFRPARGGPPAPAPADTVQRTVQRKEPDT